MPWSFSLLLRIKVHYVGNFITFLTIIYTPCHMISVSLFALKILSLISCSIVAALLQKLDPIQQEDIAAVDVAK